MEILIESYSDAFVIVVDGERFHFNQEDTLEELVDAFKKVNPGAVVKFEEVY